MKIIAFTASPRKKSNSSELLNCFLQGTAHRQTQIETFNTNTLNLKNCRGCLRCNLIKRCSLKNDDWGRIAEKILASEVIAFAAPIYFHHLPGSMKKLIDRFRSFVHVQITETGIQHTPWRHWQKTFCLFLTMGSSSASEAAPVTALFESITKILGDKNRLHGVTATRMVVPNQIAMQAHELESLYPKLNLPGHLARTDSEKNFALLDRCRELGRTILTVSPSTA